MLQAYKYRCAEEKVERKTFEVKWGGGFTTRHLKQRKPMAWKRTHGLALYLPLCLSEFLLCLSTSVLWHSTQIAQRLTDITDCPVHLLFCIYTCPFCPEAQEKACEECPGITPAIYMYINFSCTVLLVSSGRWSSGLSQRSTTDSIRKITNKKYRQMILTDAGHFPPLTTTFNGSLIGQEPCLFSCIQPSIMGKNLGFTPNTPTYYQTVVTWWNPCII